MGVLEVQLQVDPKTISARILAVDVCSVNVVQNGSDDAPDCPDCIMAATRLVRAARAQAAREPVWATLHSLQPPLDDLSAR